jgi:hypothetical protein
LPDLPRTNCLPLPAMAISRLFYQRVDLAVYGRHLGEFFELVLGRVLWIRSCSYQLRLLCHIGCFVP